MPILLYEDHASAQLEPVTLTRPAFCITCGGQRLIDALSAFGETLHLHVRPHLRACAVADFPRAKVGLEGLSGTTVCVNARLVPSSENISRIRDLLGETAHAAEAINDAVCLVETGDALSAENLEQWAPPTDSGWEMFEYPHDLIRYQLATFDDHLTAFVRAVDRQNWEQPFDGTFVERGAQLSDHVCCDTGLGPIVIREGAHIGPFSYLQGPLLIDKNAHVLPHSQIKSGTHLGRMCKVGGEVEATIIEPYSNKQHHGFLGHAYVGSWVNLGAGTSNSNLKNTYGAINAVYNDVKTPTGMQFLGCILGDYVKTAINCSFYTGKRVGAGSMLYGTITEDVPAFVNYARELRSETVITPEVIVTMQRRMFARRDVPHRDCDSALIQAAFDLTRPDRAGLETGPPAF